MHFLRTVSRDSETHRSGTGCEYFARKGLKIQ
jgi:hypothetical protein